MKQILLIFLIFIIGCSQKVEFIVKKPPKITLTKEADYFEIRNISENSSPIDTKKFIVNDSAPVKSLEPVLPYLLNHNTNSYKEHLRSAIISEISNLQKFKILRDNRNVVIYGIVPPKEKIVSVNINFTGFSKNIYSKENLSYALAIKKGNLPLMDALQIEGMTYLVIEGLERNGTGFKVDTPYIEKIYGLKADVEYYIGERIIGKDTFETFYIEKIGGEQGSTFSDLTSHVDSRIRDKINFKNGGSIEKISSEIDGLKLAFNNPDLYSAKGLNLKNDAGVIDTDTYIISLLSQDIAKKIVENIDGVEISANLKLESGDSNALNLINGNAYEEAINYLEGMNNRSDADTLNLAICYEAIGDKIQSIRFYENAAKMNSSYKSNYEDAKKRLNL
tara:strand:- start:39 stop:1214 length:1176 start_codon:yes stop_codon:yes gene_type:complete